MMQDRRDDRSLGELFAELSRETSTLIRQEVDLARTEMTRKVAGLAQGAVRAIIGGMVLYAGLLVLLAMFVFLLVDLAGLSAWLAALIVAVIVLIIGAILLMSGINALKSQDMAPRQTIQTIKEDVEWAKDQTR